eukprot:660176-Pyramimonas_sp.AAC.1
MAEELAVAGSSGSVRPDPVREPEQGRVSGVRQPHGDDPDSAARPRALREAWGTAVVVEDEHDERAQGHVQ